MPHAIAEIESPLKDCRTALQGKNAMMFVSVSARSPSGKAKVCKTFIEGSIPSRASSTSETFRPSRFVALLQLEEALSTYFCLTRVLVPVLKPCPTHQKRASGL